MRRLRLRIEEPRLTPRTNTMAAPIARPIIVPVGGRETWLSTNDRVVAPKSKEEDEDDDVAETDVGLLVETALMFNNVTGVDTVIVLNVLSAVESCDEAAIWDKSG